MRTPTLIVEPLGDGRVRVTARIGDPRAEPSPLTHVWHCPVCGEATTFARPDWVPDCTSWPTRVHGRTPMVLRRLA
jgi:hypothetical protein